jgi:broad specificity phosphatase PhoE
MTATFLFLRHAETAVSERRQWHGTADPHLSPKGLAHAHAAAGTLVALGHDIASIVTSDQRRAVETAEVLGAVLRCPVVADADLRERHLGDWAGLGLREIEAGWPGQLLAWQERRISGPPGGETDKEVAARATRALVGCAAGGSGRRLRLVVAHAGLLRGLLAASGMADEEVPPLGGRWLTVAPGRRPVAVGDVASL